MEVTSTPLPYQHIEKTITLNAKRSLDHNRAGISVLVCFVMTFYMFFNKDTFIFTLPLSLIHI